jgi:hypothetical protein
MHVSKFVVTMTIILLATAACGNTWGERAIIGGVAGAGVGAATMPEHRG